MTSGKVGYILSLFVFLLLIQGGKLYSFSHVLNELETNYNAATLEKVLNERSEKAAILQKEVAQKRYNERRAVAYTHLQSLANQSAERRLLVRQQRQALKERKIEVSLPKLTYDQFLTTLIVLLFVVALAIAVRHHGGLPEWKVFIWLRMVPAPADAILREDPNRNDEPYRVLPKLIFFRKKKAPEKSRGTQLTMEKIEKEGNGEMAQVYERRSHVRYDIYTNVTVQFIIPDQTFTPMKFNAVAEDISLLGMRVKSQDVSKEQYTELLRSMPYARVFLKLPHVEETIRLHGQIVWAKFNRPDEDEGEQEPHVVIGLRFSQFTDEAMNDFRRTLQMVVQKCQRNRLESQKVEL